VKKTKTIYFIRDLLLANLISIVAYALFVLALNFCTGGGISQLSGAFEYRGYSADDMSPALVTFIYVMLTVSYIFPFFLFYFLMFWQLKRSTREKEEFLDYIGTRRFDKNEFSKVYFEQKAKNLFVIFIVFIAAISLLKIIKIPFVNTLIMSQTIFFDMLFTKLGVTGILKNIFSAIVSLAANGAAFLFLQKKLCPKVYESWANERMRVDAE